MKQRGRALESLLAPTVVATLHPSALLRTADAAARAAAYDVLVRDLKLAVKKSG